VGCDGWGSRLTIYIANSPIIIDQQRSPTLREVINFSITSHFQMASTDDDDDDDNNNNINNKLIFKEIVIAPTCPNGGTKSSSGR